MRFVKKIVVFLISAVLLTGLSGCGIRRASSAGETALPDGLAEPAERAESGLSDQTIEQGFGSYLLPAGWIENESHSTEEKRFYILDGTDDQAQPDNIAVSVGVNRYSQEGHLEFRDAVMNQLGAQIGDLEGVTLEGSGSSTANGDILYRFEVRENDGTKTVQYYVVGDYRFCLIHETNFTGSEQTDIAAAKIADSFVWKDE